MTSLPRHTHGGPSHGNVIAHPRAPLRLNVLLRNIKCQVSQAAFSRPCAAAMFKHTEQQDRSGEIAVRTTSMRRNVGH